MATAIDESAHTKPRSFEVAQFHCDQAAAALNLDPSLARVLREIKRELIVHFPVEFDDGNFQVFTGFRVQHNIARGPCKGGVRYHSQMTLDDARALAMSTTWQAAVIDLPYGGAKGGVICDPKTLSLSELERLTRRFTTEISLLVGPDKDIPEPDLGTNAQIMAWMMDTISMHAGYSIPASVTGKPLEVGGSQGGHAAAGRGLSIVTLQVLKDYGIDLVGATVAVQGFGQVGQHAAFQFRDAGLKVVAVSDSTGAIFDQDGVDLGGIRTQVEQGGSIKDFTGSGTHINNEQLLELEVTVLVPAAVEEQIHAGNAQKVAAQVIAEGANAPVTPKADEVLNARGAIIIPDILAGAGAMAVSYFEWVQDLQAFFWNSQEVDQRLSQIMLRAYGEVKAQANMHQCSLRQAAYRIAVDKVAHATAVRGIYP